MVFFGAWLLFPIIANEGSGVIAALSRVVGLTRQAPAQITGYLLLAGFIGGVLILLLWGLLIGSWALSMLQAAMASAVYLTVAEAPPASVAEAPPGP